VNAAGTPPVCPDCGYPVTPAGDTLLHENPADGFLCSLRNGKGAS